jgi:hypothetical protein
MKKAAALVVALLAVRPALAQDLDPAKLLGAVPRDHGESAGLGPAPRDSCPDVGHRDER